MTKVVAFNGSPRKDGNTSILIKTVFQELEQQGIKTEEIQIGNKPIQGCIGCKQCWNNKDSHCVLKNDALNQWIDKILEADGVILGSPVYCAGPSGQIKSFIDRTAMVACANNDMFKRKVGASVVVARRAGTVATFHSLNSWFTILEMIIVGSSYWNMGFGREKGEVNQDTEGLQTMRNLGLNMAWLLKSLAVAKEQVLPPQTKREALTNFIRN